MRNTIKLGIRFIEYLGDVHEIIDYAVMAEQAGLGINRISPACPLGPDIRDAITLPGSKIVPHFGRWRLSQLVEHTCNYGLSSRR